MQKINESTLENAEVKSDKWNKYYQILKYILKPPKVKQQFPIVILIDQVGQKSWEGNGNTDAFINI